MIRAMISKDTHIHVHKLIHTHMHTHTHTHTHTQEAQGKIHELEGRLQGERTRVQQEKKDQGDQIRSLKAEIKSLTDKIERSVLTVVLGSGA